MQVPLLDLKIQYAAIKDEIMQELAELCDGQQFILGPKVTEFEDAVAAYCQAKYACGVTSGSDALLISLMAEGIGPGDEVITSAYSFFATAGAIWRCGATPVFVDIEPDYYSLNLTELEGKINSNTKAVIPVHLYGQSTDMDSLLALSKKHNFVIIEDACQAIGAEYSSKRVGSESEYSCLSFFPSKNLGGFGDSGMVLSNDSQRAEKLKILRNHGMHPQYHHQIIGSNFRIDALQAAVLNKKLKYLDIWTEKRQENFAFYGSAFQGCSLISTPKFAPWCTRHVGNQFVVRIKEGLRDKVWDALKEAGIGCAVYYPIPLHMQECFQHLNYKEGNFPESEKAARETLALPIYPELTAEQKEYVAETLLNILKELSL